MAKQKPTLHIYTRVSTEVQATEGTSLETQKELGIEKAKELGFNHKVWNEGGASSNYEDLDNRPVLMSLLREVEDGSIKHLYVWNNDRLSRNEITAQTIRVALQRNDVVLYTKDGKYDLANPTDKLVKTILDGIAQYDNALRAERSRLGKLNRVKNGFWQGGPPPFGYTLKDGKLAIEPEEAKWVFKIFDAYASGSSPTKIKAMLDENGVAPRRKKGTWSIGSINALMRNTHYKGTYTYEDAKSGESVEVSCPPLMEDTLWFSAQDARREVQRRKGQTNRTKKFYLLRDLMVCGHCGRQIAGRIVPSVRANWYYCPNKERTWVNGDKTQGKKWARGTGCGMDRALNIPKTDALVWDAIKEVVKNSVTLKERVKTEVLRQKQETDLVSDEAIQKLDTTGNRLTRELKNVEQSIAKVETDHMLGKIKETIYENILQNLNAELNSVEAQLAQLDIQKREATSEKRWVDWVRRYDEQYQNLDALSDDDKKAYIEALVMRLVVHLDGDTKEHTVDIEFSLPVVGDQLVYKDPTKKSLGYDIIDGESVLTITADFQDRGGIKKKDLGVNA
jgi:DNA invertase Pin-like site-specific DNA recombinase